LGFLSPFCDDLFFHPLLSLSLYSQQWLVRPEEIEAALRRDEKIFGCEINVKKLHIYFVDSEFL